MNEFRKLLEQAQWRLLGGDVLYGHRHVALFSALDLSGAVLMSWAVVTGSDGFFDILDFKIVLQWLKAKEFQPFLTGGFVAEDTPVVELSRFEVAFYAVPDEVWQKSRSFIGW